MSAANRTSDSFSRAIPFIVVAAIIVVGYLWLIQPRVTEYFRNRTEIATLEGRVRSLQDTINRGRSVPSPDESTAIKLFEERMSADDRVSYVVEQLARLAQDSGGKGKVKGLQIATEPSAQWAPGQTGMSRTATDAGDTPDPRFGLFPATFTYTPVTVAFDAAYGDIERFVWRLRDMPTMIEIRSMELTRGLPLMHANLRIFVYRRGEAVASPSVAEPPSGGPASSLAPRVARLSLAEGW